MFDSAPTFKIQTMNRVDASKLDRSAIDERIAIISITEVDSTPAALNEGAFDYVLRIEFDDTDGYKFGTPINRDDAHHILQFVDLVKDQIDLLIVHCQAGISRSPGVAVALNELYNNNKFIPPKWLNYNKLVYRTILNHYYENGYAERNEESRT